MNRSRWLTSACIAAALGLALASFLGWGDAPGVKAAAAPEPTIRVALTRGAPAAVSATSRFELKDRESGTVVECGGGEVAELSAASRGVSIRASGVSLRTFEGPVDLIPSGEGLVSVGGVRYRGTLTAANVPGEGLVVVNELPVEDYLLGVVPKEMPSDWPMEALKAQAVAARSYALWALSERTGDGRAYDVTAGMESQVYGGVAAESPRTSQAVRSTRGEVLTYNGRVARAYYHSSSGGHTENSETVWGEVVPYLRGVPDFDGGSPWYTWRAELTTGEISAALQEDGLASGEVYGLDTSMPRGVSGRLASVAVEGSFGRVVLDADDFRHALGLRSTLFEAEGRDATYHEVVCAGSPYRTVVVEGGATTARAAAAGLVAIDGQGRLHRLRRYASVACRWVPAAIVFNGRGWGHGVGMSQWGARAMAERGHTYREILEYYYSGAGVEVWGGR